jgi:hypothetical protein
MSDTQSQSTDSQGQSSGSQSQSTDSQSQSTASQNSQPPPKTPDPSYSKFTMFGIDIEPKAGNAINTYMSSTDSEIQKLQMCSKNFSDYINSDDGTQFIKNMIDPLYGQVRQKICNPTDAKAYITKIIDMPDNIQYTKTQAEKLNNMSSRIVDIEKELTEIKILLLLATRNTPPADGFTKATVITLIFLIVIFFCMTALLGYTVYNAK